MSPPQEHITGSQWWTDYQPVSYTLTSKRGNRSQFQKLVHSYIFWDSPTFLYLLANFYVSVWYPHAILLVWKSSSVGTLSFYPRNIFVILIIMIRHHLQSHGWNRQRNWCSWKFFHTLCISRNLSEPGSLEIPFRSSSFAISIPKFVVTGLSLLRPWDW